MVKYRFFLRLLNRFHHKQTLHLYFVGVKGVEAALLGCQLMSLCCGALSFIIISPFLWTFICIQLKHSISHVFIKLDDSKSSFLYLMNPSMVTEYHVSFVLQCSMLGSTEEMPRAPTTASSSLDPTTKRPWRSASMNLQLQRVSLPTVCDLYKLIKYVWNAYESVSVWGSNCILNQTEILHC